MQISVLSSLAQINHITWQSITANHNSPFIQSKFLSLLEQSGCVQKETGWIPQHIALSNQQSITTLLPLYIKSHSWGEYVFDWAWAEAFEQFGVPYYPKLVAAIPFTPVPCHKVIGTSVNLSSVFQLLTSICKQSNINSWHYLYHDNNQNKPPLEHNNNVFERYSVQFHWHNKNYESFDQYLDSFTARKRKQVKKERYSIKQQGIEIRRVNGNELTEQELQFFVRVYQKTYLTRDHQPHLNKTFFHEACHHLGNNMLFIFASTQGEDVACALFFKDDKNLYGRYWGCSTQYNNLHFELCYYQGIEYCIDQGLTHFNPGTQGEHKLARGFEPVICRSFHWIKEIAFRDAIAQFCKQEQQDMLAYAKRCQEHLPFKQQVV